MKGFTLKLFGIMMALVVMGISGLVIDNSIIPVHIGLVDGKFAEMPHKDNAVSSQTKDESKFVDPLPVIESIENSKAILMNIIETYGTAEIVVSDHNYIHVVFTTDKMKYKDDVEFYFDESENVIHYRSESRIGYSDMGLNRKRYEEIRALYLNN